MDLPYEIIFHLGLYVKIADLPSFFGVSRMFYGVSQDSHFWWERLIRDFPKHQPVSSISSAKHQYIHLVLSSWHHLADALIFEPPADPEYLELWKQENTLIQELHKIQGARHRLERLRQQQGYRLRAQANNLEPLQDQENYYPVQLSPQDIQYVHQCLSGQWETNHDIASYLPSYYRGINLKPHDLIGFLSTTDSSDAVPAILVYIEDQGQPYAYGFSYGYKELPTSLIWDMQRDGLTRDDIQRIYRLPFHPPEPKTMPY
jgi:hypothetical protein